MSDTYNQICYFSRNISINPKSRTRFNLLKKNCMLWFACCLLELDSGRVINIFTKKKFFSFFVLSLSENKKRNNNN